jgi:hypothetical protein
VGSTLVHQLPLQLVELFVCNGPIHFPGHVLQHTFYGRRQLCNATISIREVSKPKGWATVKKWIKDLRCGPFFGAWVPRSAEGRKSAAANANKPSKLETKIFERQNIGNLAFFISFGSFFSGVFVGVSTS